jgi:phosphoglycolate phosphatase-like HAD superfamily hydrolase
MKRCYVFDIDGTLADCSHRLHHITSGAKDWRAFFAACDRDEPIYHICELQRVLAYCEPMVLVSGRSDECRAATEQWLSDNGIRFNALYMRKAGDHRPDDIVKGELLDQALADGWKPLMAFDDRDRVVAMWRERGIPCAQVAEGDF